MRHISRKKPCSWPSWPRLLTRHPESLPEPGNQPSKPLLRQLATPQPEPPKTLEPLCPKKNLGDYLFALAHGYRRDNPPKHIPDRRWEEDFGNPRNFW